MFDKFNNWFDNIQEPKKFSMFLLLAIIPIIILFGFYPLLG